VGRGASGDLDSHLRPQYARNIAKEMSYGNDD
jgi:hypothetical protein